MEQQKPIGWTLLATILVSFAAAGTTRAEMAADTQRDRLQSATLQLHGWLGDSENGRRWKQFLHADDLQRQLQRGRQADRKVVTEIHAIYAGGTAGLERPQFVAVRTALQQWLAELPATAAKTGSQPVSKNQPQVTGASTVATASTVAVQDPPPVEPAKPADALIQTADAEAASFSTIPQTEVQTARRDLDSAIRQMDQLMSLWTVANRDGWKKYLEWDAMKAELAKPQPDPRRLNRFLGRYYRDLEGLELRQFDRVRDSLQKYATAAFYASQPKLDQLYQRQLDEFKAGLEKYRETRSLDEATRIGRVLGWLRDSRQARRLVRQANQRFGRPNLHARVSERLIAAGFNEPVYEVTPINENILGTSICGTATTTGQVTVDLVPNHSRASLLLRLTGSAQSNNVGHNRGVQVRTAGSTSIQGNKMLYLDEAGVSGQGASACCNTSTQICGISAKRKIVERIARKKAAQQKGPAERIASRRAEQRVAQGMDERAAGLIAKANQQLEVEIRKPLRRRDAYPESIQVSSSSDYLTLRMTRRSRRQIAATDAPPPITGSHDLSVRLHETMVINYAESILGGETLTDEKLVKLLEDSGREVPPELTEGDPWSITFDSARPISARFDDSKVRIALRGRRFSRRGGAPLRKLLEISAEYDLQRTPAGPKLVRTEDVKVIFVGRDRIDIAEVAAKKFLSSKFEALFVREPKLTSEGLKLPGRWERAGQLNLDELAANGGWLSLGWFQGPAKEAAKVAKVAATQTVRR